MLILSWKTGFRASLAAMWTATCPNSKGTPADSIDLIVYQLAAIATA